MVALREQAAALRARAAAEPIPQSPDAPTTALKQSPDAPTTALPQSPDEPLCWAPVPGSPGLERRIGLDSQPPGTLTPSRAGGGGGGGGGGGRDGDDEGDGSPRVRLVVRSSPLRASHRSRVHEDWTLPNMDEELLEDVTHRQQTATPNTALEGVSGAPVAGATGATLNTALEGVSGAPVAGATGVAPNTALEGVSGAPVAGATGAAPTTALEGVSGAPVAGATGAAPNTARAAPALRTAPIAGIEAEREWLRSLPVLPSLPTLPTLAEARRAKTERPLPPVERASEEDPSVLRF